jgi:hypothetical protein
MEPMTGCEPATRCLRKTIMLLLDTQFESGAYRFSCANVQNRCYTGGDRGSASYRLSRPWTIASVSMMGTTTTARISELAALLAAEERNAEEAIGPAQGGAGEQSP